MPPCKISWWKDVNEKGKKILIPNLQDFKFGQDGWKAFFMKISWIWTCSQIFRKSSYWENMLLFWIMLKKASAHLRLWVIIFTQERSPRQTCTYLKSTIETLNSKDNGTTFYCIYYKLWACFKPFSSVSAVDFEQVNICWVPPYQFINAEITYCCNY